MNARFAAAMARALVEETQTEPPARGTSQHPRPSGALARESFPRVEQQGTAKRIVFPGLRLEIAQATRERIPEPGRVGEDVQAHGKDH